MSACIEAKGERRKGYVVRKRLVNGVRKNVRAHREEWEKAYGPIADDVHVLHRCDNRACINLTHLFLGSNQDNVDDCLVKGRNSKNERNGRSKLSWEDVRAIRQSSLPGIELAETYGVNPSAISKVRTGKAWNDLT